MKNKNSKNSLIRKWPELLTKTNAQINGQNEALVVTIEKYFFASSRGQRLLNGFFFFVLSLTRSATSPSFDVRLHGSSSIPIASFVERSLFIKTFCIESTQTAELCIVLVIKEHSIRRLLRTKKCTWYTAT